MRNCSREEMIGRNITELKAPLQGFDVVAVGTKLMNEGEIEYEATRFVEGRGWLNIGVNARVVETEGKKLILNIERDITNRKKMEKVIKESEEKFFRIFYTNPISMVIASCGDEIINNVNKSFTELSGYDRKECIGRKVDDFHLLVSESDMYKIKEMMSRHGRIRDFETEIRVKSGEIRTILLSADTVDLAGIPYMVFSHRDITEQRKMNERLQQSQLLASLGNDDGGNSP
jgi:PAS domain S-box-containing protein